MTDDFESTGEILNKMAFLLLLKAIDSGIITAEEAAKPLYESFGGRLASQGELAFIKATGRKFEVIEDHETFYRPGGACLKGKIIYTFSDPVETGPNDLVGFHPSEVHCVEHEGKLIQTAPRFVWVKEITEESE